MVKFDGFVILTSRWLLEASVFFKIVPYRFVNIGADPEEAIRFAKRIDLLRQFVTVPMCDLLC